MVDAHVVSGTAAQFRRAVETLDTPAVIALAGTLACKDCECIHRVEIDEDGKIWRITDMVRPLSAVLAMQTAARERT